jgi:predicted nuclease with RNAse H fold
MLTVGVDLAAEPERTAVARIEWSSGRARICDVVCGADDGMIVAAIAEAQKAGVDCPLGWPDDFVAFVAAHQAGHVTVPGDVTGREWRRRLTLRLTDRVVRAETGLTPLSVSADRIGHVALRCAGLLAQLARQGQAVDRSGSGTVVEVYPAASLKRWGLPYRGYKRPGDTHALGHLVDQLLAAAPWLEGGGTESLCRRSHDATDAVVAALTARAASQSLTSPPTARQEPAARTEGWIAVPTTPLNQLA